MAQAGGGQSGMEPARVTQLALGYWPSRAFLAAVELDLFAVLDASPLTRDELAGRLGLRSRSVGDFLDALVALGLLQRDGAGDGARYGNVPGGAPLLADPDDEQRAWLADLADPERFRRWSRLTDALRSGEGDTGLFDDLYGDPDRLAHFLRAMTAVSGPGFVALAESVDWSATRTVCDVGGGAGDLAVALARRHSHLRVISLDRPEVVPIAERTVAEAGVGDRVVVAGGDFLADALPRADALVMSLVLLDWDEERKERLLRSAHEALPPGGRLFVIDRLDDDGDQPSAERGAFELLRSLDLLLAHGDAHTYTADQLRTWFDRAGFADVEIRPLVGDLSLAVARR
jgi:predicted O-methyltransferase YrrM